MVFNEHIAYIEEPRWSWYGSPLWRCDAWSITVTLPSHEMFTVDNSYYCTIYLTDEERVMFKLSSFADSEETIKKGIVYING